MDGAEAEVLQHRVEKGDVAVAEQGLGVARHGPPIDAEIEALRAVAAAQAEDALDLGVEEGGVDVRGADGVVAGEVAAARAGAGVDLGRKAQGAHGLLRRFEPALGQRAGGRQQRHAAPLPKRRQGRQMRIHGKNVLSADKGAPQRALVR